MTTSLAGESTPLARLPRAFFQRDATTMARDLLGRFLVRRIGAERLVLRIVETEAYLGVDDPASHAFEGRRTARTATMYEAGGVAYVYLIYGMHHCLNVVTGIRETASAVLLRGGEPVQRGAAMAARRGLGAAPRAGDIAGGPGKLCHALAIDRTFDGVSLARGALRVAPGLPIADAEVVRGPRIGVDYAGPAALWPLRFAIRGNPHVSRPRPGR